MKITRGILPKAILALATCAVMVSPAAAQIVFNSEFNPVTPTFGGVVNGRPFGNIKFYAEGFESFNDGDDLATTPGPWQGPGGHGFVHARPFFPDPNTDFEIQPTGFVALVPTEAAKYGWTSEVGNQGKYLQLTWPAEQFSTNSQFVGAYSDGTGGMTNPSPASPTPTTSTQIRTVPDLPTGLYDLSFRIAAINDLDGESGENFPDGIDLNSSGTIESDPFNSGADEFEIQLNGETVFRGSFDNDDINDQNAHEELTAAFTGSNTNDSDTGNGNVGFNTELGNSGNQNDSLYEFNVQFGHAQGNGPIDLTFLPLGGIFGSIVDRSQIEIFGIDDLLIQNVITPEPTSFVLYGVALVGIGGVAYCRRRRNRAQR